MSSVITNSTFQFDTDQIIQTAEVTNVAAETGEGCSARVAEAAGPYRDNSTLAATHHRQAERLQAYTRWLKSRWSGETGQSDDRRGAVTPPAHHMPIRKPDVGNSRPLGTRTSCRIDNAQSGTNASTMAAPHFETRNYVPPMPDHSTPAAIPTDGFDPVIEIHAELDRLNESGRVIGSLDSPNLDTQTISTVPQFRWPSMTTRLIGSPAMLNLERHVHNAIDSDRQQVVICSSRNGVGGSTIAMSLARQLASHGSRVLLVDANLTHPALASQLGLTPQICWLRGVTENRPPNELIVKQKSAPVSIMPLRQILHHVAWPRKTFDQLNRLIQPIASRYDAVIIDAGIVQQLVAESTSPSRETAIALLVGGTEPDAWKDQEAAQSALLSFGMTNLLLVQNFSQIRSACAHAG